MCGKTYQSDMCCARSWWNNEREADSYRHYDRNDREKQPNSRYSEDTSVIHQMRVALKQGRQIIIKW